MASANDPRAITASLGTTTADIVILTQPWDRIEVTNTHATVPVYVVFNTTTAPTSAAAGTQIVPALSNRVFPAKMQAGGIPGNTTASTACHVVGIVGNANTYSITGLAGQVG